MDEPTKTVAEKLADVRAAWSVYQAEAAAEGKALTASLPKYWAAVRAVSAR